MNNSLRKIIQQALSELPIQEGHYTTWKSLEEGEDSLFQDQQQEIIQKLSKHFNIKKIAPLGSGTSGFAYYIPNNRVLKVTKDKSEVVESRKIQKKKLKHIANIYGTYTLSGKYADTYVIISELLTQTDDIDAAEGYLTDFFEEEFGYSLMWLFDDFKSGSVGKDELKDYKKRIAEYFEPSKSKLAIWYMEGMLGIIDELKKYQIHSTDYGRSNLGVKKDGNLAMYDLGYGDQNMSNDIQNIHLNEFIKSNPYPEFTDGQFNPLFKNRPYPPDANMNTAPLSELYGKPNISPEAIKYLLNKMKISNATYLGSGASGDAYQFDNRVIKFTKDIKEARFAQKLAGKNFAHIANIYKVSRYAEKAGDWIYIILMEKLQPLTEEYKKIYFLYEKVFSAYEEFVGTTGQDIPFEYALKNADAPEFDDFFETWKRRHIKEHMQDFIQIDKQVEETKKEVQKVMKDSVYGNLHDLHSGNIGLKPNGNLAFFDMRWHGFSGHPEKMKTISETEISQEEINKKELPFKFPELFDDFVLAKTEPEIREVAPDINLNKSPELIIMDLQTNYPSLFDNFAEWIFDNQKSNTTFR